MSAIRDDTAACVRLFRSLATCLETGGAAVQDSIDPVTLGDEHGRFRVWAGNLGAQQRGHSSLDYRLRDSPLLYSNVLKLLDELKVNLSETSSVLTGARLPYEQQQSSEDFSDDDDSSEDSDSDDSDERPQTELEQRMLEVVDIIDNLYKLSIRIRNPTLQSRSLKAAAFRPKDPDTGIDLLSQYLIHDRKHTVELFQEARQDSSSPKHDDSDTEWLIERLSRAITKRRQQFKYWRKHRDKLATWHEPVAPPTVPTANHVAPQADLLQPRHVLTGFTIEVNHAPASDKVPKTILSGTEATAHDRTLDDAVDSKSVTSVATTARDLSGHGVDLPPPPKSADGDQDFECPYCFVICPARYGGTRSWKTHILQDLQPYVCTYEHCASPDQLFKSRREWLEHESSSHRKLWRCPTHHEAVYSSKEALRNHLDQLHADELTEQQKDNVAIVAETSAIDTREFCPVCRVDAEEVGNLSTHIANHLERIAAFALPRNTEENQDDSAASNHASRGRIDDSESSYNSSQAWSEEGNPQTTTPSRATVTGFSDSDGSIWFEVLCQMRNGTNWKLKRLYGDFYQLYRGLLEAFPAERTMSDFPGPVLFVNDDVSLWRVSALNGSLKALLTREDRFVCHRLVHDFFRPTESDVPIGALNDDDFGIAIKVESIPSSQPSDASSNNLGIQWPLSWILRWMRDGGFSEEWRDAFTALHVMGALFLELGSETGLSTIENVVIPAVARTFETGGTSFVESEAMDDGKKLQQLIRMIINNGGLRDEALEAQPAVIARSGDDFDDGTKSNISEHDQNATTLQKMSQTTQHLSSSFVQLLHLNDISPYEEDLSLAIDTLSSLSSSLSSIQEDILGSRLRRRLVRTDMGRMFREGLDSLSQSLQRTGLVVEKIVTQETKPKDKWERLSREFTDEGQALHYRLILYELFLTELSDVLQGDTYHKKVDLEDTARKLSDLLQQQVLHANRAVLTNIDTEDTADQDPRYRDWFIYQLSDYLEDPLRDGLLLSWTRGGDSFIILDEDVFGQVVLPQKFHIPGIDAFEKTLALYGFEKKTRVSNDTTDSVVPPRIEYSHEKFRRDNPELRRQIQKPTDPKKVEELTRLNPYLALWQTKRQQSKADSRVVKMDEIPTISELYRKGTLQPTQIVEPPNKDFNARISLLYQDIAAIEVDAIVNASNERLIPYSGAINGHIHDIAGPGLAKECESLGNCPIGNAVVTGAYYLPCQKVIHAVGPGWDYRDVSSPLLASCYEKSLQHVADLGLKTVAFPCLSAGQNGFPEKRAATLALETVRKFLGTASGKQIQRVVFCVYTPEDEEAYKQTIPIYFPPTTQEQEETSGTFDQAPPSPAPVVPAPLPLPSKATQAKKEVAERLKELQEFIIAQHAPMPQVGENEVTAVKNALRAVLLARCKGEEEKLEMSYRLILAQMKVQGMQRQAAEAQENVEKAEATKEAVEEAVEKKRVADYAAELLTAATKAHEGFMAKAAEAENAAKEVADVLLAEDKVAAENAQKGKEAVEAEAQRPKMDYDEDRYSSPASRGESDDEDQSENPSDEARSLNEPTTQQGESGADLEPWMCCRCFARPIIQAHCINCFHKHCKDCFQDSNDGRLYRPVPRLWKIPLHLPGDEASTGRQSTRQRVRSRPNTPHQVFEADAGEDSDFGYVNPDMGHSRSTSIPASASASSKVMPHDEKGSTLSSQPLAGLPVQESGEESEPDTRPKLARSGKDSSSSQTSARWKLHREALAVDTLTWFNIDWLYAGSDSIVILREISKERIDILLEHSRRHLARLPGAVADFFGDGFNTDDVYRGRDAGDNQVEGVFEKNGSWYCFFDDDAYLYLLNGYAIKGETLISSGDVLSVLDANGQMLYKWRLECSNILQREKTIQEEAFCRCNNHLSSGANELNFYPNRGTASDAALEDAQSIPGVKFVPASNPGASEWTEIERRLVNPEALKETEHVFSAGPRVVFVEGMLNAHEIRPLMARTKEIRDGRTARENAKKERERSKKEGRAKRREGRALKKRASSVEDAEAEADAPLV